MATTVTVGSGDAILVTAGVSESGFQNALGYRVLAAGSGPGPDQIIFTNDDVVAGQQFDLGSFTPGTSLEFFILQNGGALLTGDDQATVTTDATGRTSVAFEDLAFDVASNPRGLVRDNDFNDVVFSVDSRGGTGGEPGTGRLIVLSEGLGSGGVLDVVFSQDLSGSFGDDIATVRGLVGDIFTAVESAASDSRLGITSFVDKPTSPFGNAGSGDYAYRTDLPLGTDLGALQATYDGLVIRDGVDLPESQFEALLQIANRDGEIGFRAGSTKVAVVFTDAVPHVAGDFSGVPANDGDAVLDGSPPGTGEDYPSADQVRDALSAAQITAVFAVTDDVAPAYRAIVAGWGFGSVVSLTSNSSNIVDAITAGLGTIGGSPVLTANGTEFDDTIVGNSADNTLTGNGGADIFRFVDTDPTAPRAQFGQDVITDFSTVEGDKIDLSAFGFTATALGAPGVLTVTGANTVVAAGDWSITVAGRTDLATTDFILA